MDFDCMKEFIFRISLTLTAALGIFHFSSCISGTAVKTLGRGTLNLVKTDTANSTTFKFDFAYRDSSDGTSTGTPSSTVYLRGIANSKNVMIATCNSTGSNCTCDYFNSTGTQLAPSTPILTSYNEGGNFFLCSNGGIAVASIASVRIRTNSSSKISETLTLKTGINNLTISNIMGDLDINRVRGIFRYRCMWTFLQKLGTSTSGFSCADASATTAGGTLAAARDRNCGDSTATDEAQKYQGDLCFLKVQYPYFVFRDANLNNFSLRTSDGLYSSVGSCFPLLKRFDCTSTQKFAPTETAETGVEPTAVLGLMADQVGVFETPISFQASPLVSDSAYGFAANTITFNSLTLCPPGLSKFQSYTATPDNGFTAFPSQGAALSTTNHNFPSNFTAKNVDQEPQTAETSATGVPGPLQVVKLIGAGANRVTGAAGEGPSPFLGDTGDCFTSGTSTSCQFPDRRQTSTAGGTLAVGSTSTSNGVAQVKSWTGSGTIFCGIPASKVPNTVNGG